MSQLSEERIEELYFGELDNRTLSFARAIEREAYKAGQERMRERAARRVGHFETACAAIRNLEIEEPK